MTELPFDEPLLYECQQCGEEYEGDYNLNRHGTDYCTECYTNDDCPDGCGEPHAGPTPDSDGTWTCPTTEATYVYEGDARPSEYARVDHWSQRRYVDSSTYVPPADAWYIDPSDWEWSTCDHCGNWTHLDDLNYDEDDESYHCASCPSDHEVHGTQITGVQARCSGCGHNAPTVYDLMTETVYCGSCDAIPPGRTKYLRKICVVPERMAA